MGVMVTPDFFVALFASDGNHGSCLVFDMGDTGIEPVTSSV